MVISKKVVFWKKRCSFRFSCHREDIWLSQDEFSRVYTHPRARPQGGKLSGGKKTKKQQAEGVLCDKVKIRYTTDKVTGRERCV